MIVNRRDTTLFEVDLLEVYRTLLKSYILGLLVNYSQADMNQTKKHPFDILFLTPSNMASYFYKTDFFISTTIVDGIQMQEKSDFLNSEYTDVTNVDDQVHFTFEE